MFNISNGVDTVYPKYFKGENFHGFQGFVNSLNLENFVLHYNSILSFFAIHKIFITKMLKAMNPKKF